MVGHKLWTVPALSRPGRMSFLLFWFDRLFYSEQDSRLLNASVVRTAEADPKNGCHSLQGYAETRLKEETHPAPESHQPQPQT